MATRVEELTEADLRRIIADHYRNQGLDPGMMSFSYDRGWGTPLDPGSGLSVRVTMNDQTRPVGDSAYARGPRDRG